MWRYPQPVLGFATSTVGGRPVTDASRSRAAAEVHLPGRDRGEEAAVDVEVDAVDVARRGRAEEGECGRDLAGSDQAPGHLADVPVDDLVARARPEVLVQRGVDRPGTGGVDADAALVQRRPGEP